jgi:hypothetical protein
VTNFARLKIFSIVYGVSYMAFFLYSESCACAMFRYYPVLGQFSMETLPVQQAGLPINWYSWLLGALVVSVVAMYAVPRSLAERLPHSWTWGITLMLLVGIMVYERRWFY